MKPLDLLAVASIGLMLTSLGRTLAHAQPRRAVVEHPAAPRIESHELTAARLAMGAQMDMVRHVYLQHRSCTDQSPVCWAAPDRTYHCALWSRLPAPARLVFARCRVPARGDTALTDRCSDSTAEAFGDEHFPAP